MPIDRTATLRNAEKFLRQGKLDSAIAEYLRVVEDQPRDWNTANVLGDLYARAGQADKAIEQFARIADNLAAEGFLPKAAALYKKILKLRSDHEHALLAAAEIAAAQGLLADARAHFRTVADRRRAAGDDRGVAEVDVRLGALDPADYRARIGAARARARLGSPQDAVVELKTIAAELVEKGRDGEAADALRTASELDPDDRAVQTQLLHACIASGSVADARQWARTPADYTAIAAALSAKGEDAEAGDVLRHALGRYPDDPELRSGLARALLACGDVEGAAEFFTGEAADPALTLRIAETHLAAGRLDPALGLLRQLVQNDPLQRDLVVRLAWDLAPRVTDPAFSIVNLMVDLAVEQGDFNWAALALQEFTRQIPGHVPALLRFVEVCVDGGLDRLTPIAQADLADAYLETGAAAEARVIAEDLAIRNPSKAANVDRLRRVLDLAGEPDPDSVIADLLNPSPVEQDLVLAAELPEGHSAESPPLQDTDDGEAEKPALGTRAADVDIERFMRELDKPPAPAAAAPRAQPDAIEIDLSVVLDSIKPAAAPVPLPAETASQPVPADLDDVFRQLRQEKVRRPGDAGEQDYTRAVALFDAGDADAALDALSAAARSPRIRFRAATLAARICRSRGLSAQAIEWLERAAEAPAPSSESAHALLYDLAELLEAEGEPARALAVCLELQADAGEYRDVSARVDRLARVQARG